VCKNVEITGSVILVIWSKHSILGITVKASSSNDNKCDTASGMTELVCVVSASVNNNKSPEAFLYPYARAQFFPIHPAEFGVASSEMTLRYFFAYLFIITPIESSDESLIATIS